MKNIIKPKFKNTMLESHWIDKPTDNKDVVWNLCIKFLNQHLDIPPDVVPVITQEFLSSISVAIATPEQLLNMVLASIVSGTLGDDEEKDPG